MDSRLTLITLSGAVDMASERRLRSDLSAAAGDPSRAVVLDLRGVTFIDSTGLAVLVHAGQQFGRQGRSVGCVVGEGPVRRLLATTGMRDELLLFDTPEEAAARLVPAAALDPAVHRDRGGNP